MTDAEFTHLVGRIKEIDSDLAAHLIAAKECIDRPGPMNLKLAAHALREFNVLYPLARGVENPPELRRRAVDRRHFGVVAPDDGGASGGGRSQNLSNPDSSDAAAAAQAPTSSDACAAFEPSGEAFASLLLRAIAQNDPTGQHSGHVRPTVKRWNRLNEWFVKQCHHRAALSQLELERQAFGINWGYLLKILQTLHGQVIQVLPELRLLGAQDPQAPGSHDGALALLSKPEAFRRFLVEYAGGQWFEFLQNQGYFDSPYEPVEDGDLISFPPWPPSQYMARIAALRPNEIAGFIRKRGGELRNASIQADFVEAAIAMPPDVAAGLVPTFRRWLRRRVSSRVPFLLGDLCVRLAAEGRQTAALQLMKAMLSCREPDSGAVHLRKVTPRFDRYTYEMVLKKCEAALLGECGAELFELLVRLLRTVVHAEHGSDHDDFSWMWAEDLDAEEGFSDGIAEALAMAIVRVARSHLAIHPEQLEELMGQLASPPHAIFRRLQLFILAERAPTSAFARLCLLDRELFAEPSLRAEYSRLLVAAWDDLDSSSQETILAWVLAGPVSPGGEDDGHEDAEQEQVIRARKEAWQFGWLDPIAASLQGAALELHEALRPAYSSAQSFNEFKRFGWVGPTSPLSRDSLQAKTPREVLEYLRAWKPAAELMSPSPEGLARDLAEVIKAGRQGWSALASEFQQRLDPVYQRAFFEGLSDEHGGDAELDWPAVLGLCDHVLSSGASSEESAASVPAAPHREICRAMATLIQRALRGQLGLTLEHRERVWAIITRLAHDPDPEPDAHEHLRGLMAAPEVVALNSVRGVAMHAALEYALWVTRALKADGRESTGWFEELPEVRLLFDEKLDAQREPCTAVPSVLAHYLPNLLYLDRDWLRTSLDKLFGDFGPAWEVYLLFAQVHLGVVPMLRDRYAEACRRLVSSPVSDRGKELDQALTTHVLLLHVYCADVVPALDELVEAFFEHASPSLRSYLLRQAGWHVEHQPDLSGRSLERIMALMEQRIRFAAGADAVAAHAELSDWEPLCRASAFPDSWVTEMAKLALTASPGVAADLWLPERMGKVADADLSGALEVLRLASSRPLLPLGLHNWTEPASKIIRLAVAQGGDKLEAAREVVNNFSERGYAVFESLLPGDPAAPQG